MKLRRYGWGIWALLMGGLMALPSAWAEKMETGVSFGPAFYSGSPSASLTPTFGFQTSYHSAIIFSSIFNWSHRFDLGLLLLGRNLAGQSTNYNGVSGSYITALRVNFSKKRVVPYIEAGPVLGIYALYTSGGNAATNSANQTALKYGYTVGTGFDMVETTRGSGGWGIFVSYFNLLKSIPIFEFPVGPVDAKGVKLDIRFLFGDGKR